MIWKIYCDSFFFFFLDIVLPDPQAAAGNHDLGFVIILCLYFFQTVAALTLSIFHDVSKKLKYKCETKFRKKKKKINNSCFSSVNTNKGPAALGVWMSGGLSAIPAVELQLSVCFNCCIISPPTLSPTVGETQAHSSLMFLFVWHEHGIHTESEHGQIYFLQNLHQRNPIALRQAPGKQSRQDG